MSQRINWSAVLPRAAEIVGEYVTVVTLRQLHYRLVSEATGGYVNTQSAYKQLSALTAKARRAGTFPALSDLTRSITVAPSWSSPKDALTDAAESYRRDRTEGQAVVPVVVIEKATLTAQVYSWFGGLGLQVVPLRGYQSESFDREILASMEPHRAYRVLYVGDFDPTGEDIDRHARAMFGHAVTDWERVALTRDIVRDYELPVAMGKTTDSRAADFLLRHGELVQVEVEALDPADLRALLQTSLNKTWDTSMYEAVVEREDEERDRLWEIADRA